MPKQPPNEQNIQSAIADFNAGEFLSLRAAGRAYNVPESTLRSRVKGAVPCAIAHQHQQKLTPDEEEVLVNWILDEDSRAQPPSHARVREMALRILSQHDPKPHLGKAWVATFLSRQPRVASIVGRSIEVSRARAGDYETIKAFLELFEATRKRLHIRHEDIWNMDETGVALGVCSNSQVIASSKKRKAYVKTPGDREWVSVIEAISATGKKLRPLTIFKGKNLQTTWFSPRAIPDWFYTTSDNGWTSSPTGLEWLRRIFVPGSKPDEARNRLLLIDGHGSHTHIDFMWECQENRIFVLYLPAHSSHILQPLDLSSFSVVKSKYRDEIRRLSALDDAAPVKKERFIAAYNKARMDGLSERVIRAGWRAAGLLPYNPELVLSSSQITARPRTPPRALSPQNAMAQALKTPQKPHDILAARKLLQRSNQFSKSAQVALSKASKAMAIYSTRAAQLQAENERLLQQLGSSNSSIARKCIKQNPNKMFSTMDEIRAAIDAAAATAAVKATKTTRKKAERAVIDAATSALQSMCTQFKI